jgi:hypothetical protein
LGTDSDYSPGFAAREDNSRPDFGTKPSSSGIDERNLRISPANYALLGFLDGGSLTLGRRSIPARGSSRLERKLQVARVGGLQGLAQSRQAIDALLLISAAENQDSPPVCLIYITDMHFALLAHATK